MNNIIQNQNSDRNIDLLCAQRQSYNASKSVFHRRVVASLFLAIFGPLLLVFAPSANVALPLFAIFYLVVDLLWLRRIEKNFRDDGARIQEVFDTGLFNLSWNEVTCGEKPDSELVSKRKEQFLTNHDTSNLIDWYPNEIGRLDLQRARLVCQRTNLWWDVDLRHKLFWLILGTIVMMLFGIVAVFNSEVPVLIGALFLMLPFFEVASGYARDQFLTIGSTRDLKRLVDRYIESEDFTDVASRNIQDNIFRHRSSAPFVPNWFYERFRSQQENQMNYGASHYVSKLSK